MHTLYLSFARFRRLFDCPTFISSPQAANSCSRASFRSCSADDVAIKKGVAPAPGGYDEGGAPLKPSAVSEAKLSIAKQAKLIR